MEIGEKIRRARLQKGIKQEELAERIGVAQKTYSLIENDKGKVDIKLLQKIAEELEVPIQDLLPIETFNYYDNCHSSAYGNENTLNLQDLEVIKTLQEQLKVKDQQIEQLLALLKK